MMITAKFISFQPGKWATWDC